MFVVEKRAAATFIPLIQKNVSFGTEIISDEWKAYCKLNLHGYKNFTVNHKENYVNLVTGKHTQQTKNYQKNERYHERKITIS
jgi:hypothetical protein